MTHQVYSSEDYKLVRVTPADQYQLLKKTVTLDKGLLKPRYTLIMDTTFPQCEGLGRKYAMRFPKIQEIYSLLRNTESNPNVSRQVWIQNTAELIDDTVHYFINNRSLSEAINLKSCNFVRFDGTKIKLTKTLQGINSEVEYFNSKHNEYYRKYYIKLWVSIDQDYKCTLYRPIAGYRIQPSEYRHVCLLIDYKEKDRDLDIFQPDKPIQKRAILGAVALAGRYLGPIALNLLKKLTANNLANFIDTTMQSLEINKNLELEAVTDNQLQLQLRRNLTSKVKAYLVNKISGNTKAYLAKLARSMFLEKTKNQEKMAIVEDLTQLNSGIISYSYAKKIEQNPDKLFSLPITKINGLWASINTKKDQCRYNILAIGSTENCEFELNNKPNFNILWQNQHEVLALIIKSQVIYQTKCKGTNTVIPLRQQFNLITLDKKCETFAFLKFLNNLQKIIPSSNKDLSFEHKKMNSTAYTILLSYSIQQGHSILEIIAYSLLAIVTLSILAIGIIRLYNKKFHSGIWVNQSTGVTASTL